MDAKLVVVGGDAKATEVRLKLPAVIGRGREATLTLPHPLVSRRHCEIVESNGNLIVRDMGSLNGTFINNQRITEAPLPPGELLTIGTITFRAVYNARPQAAGDNGTDDNDEFEIALPDEADTVGPANAELLSTQSLKPPKTENDDEDLADFLSSLN